MFYTQRGAGSIPLRWAVKRANNKKELQKSRCVKFAKYLPKMTMCINYENSRKKYFQIDFKRIFDREPSRNRDLKNFYVEVVFVLANQ